MRGVVLFACLLFVSAFSTAASAAHADDVKASLLEARKGVIALLDATDAAAQDTLVAQIVTATAGVDRALSAAQSDAATPAEQKAKFKEFGEVWSAFKKTRDSEIIPAVRAGNKDAAKAVAKGIQAERFKKMNELLAGLGAK